MKSLYTSVASGLVFPLHERLKGHHSVPLRRQLEASQWLSPAELQALRDIAATADRDNLYFHGEELSRVKPGKR